MHVCGLHAYVSPMKQTPRNLHDPISNNNNSDKKYDHLRSMSFGVNLRVPSCPFDSGLFIACPVNKTYHIFVYSSFRTHGALAELNTRTSP